MWLGAGFEIGRNLRFPAWANQSLVPEQRQILDQRTAAKQDARRQSWTSLQRCQTHAGRRLAASASRLGCLCTPLRNVLGDTSDAAKRSTIVFKPAALRQAVQQLLVWCTGIGALCFRPGSRSWKCPHLRAHRCALHCLRKQSRRGGGDRREGPKRSVQWQSGPGRNENASVAKTQRCGGCAACKSHAFLLANPNPPSERPLRPEGFGQWLRGSAPFAKVFGVASWADVPANSATHGMSQPSLRQSKRARHVCETTRQKQCSNNRCL